ncbi:hypothetical protein H6503_01765 [Candidatus Woesearchaeota archaeon]|nr:hypothetical protein [Candidatus Woesearchaeota archaeon]
MRWMRKGSMTIEVVVGLALLLLFVALTFAGQIPKIIDYSKSSTHLLDTASLNEENLFNFIKANLHDKLYVEAEQLCTEFISRYPSSYRVHEVYYLKLYSLTMQNKHDEIPSLIQTYDSLYPAEKREFDYKGAANDFEAWTYMNKTAYHILDREYGDAITEIESKIDIAAGTFDPLLFTTIKWPHVERYEFPVNSFFFSWYWYIYSIESDKSCELNLIQDNFEVLFSCYSEDYQECKEYSTPEYTQAFYSYILDKGLCVEQFSLASLKRFDFNLSLINYNNPYNIIVDITLLKVFDTNSLFSNYYSVSKDYLLYLKEKVDHPDNIKFKVSVTPKTTSDETMILWNLLAGIVKAREADGLLKKDCGDGQYKDLADLYSLDGKTDDLKKNLIPGKWLISKSLGNCMDDEIKEKFKESYESFNIAFNSIDTSSKLDIVNGAAMKVTLSEDEIKKYKALVYPYLLQSSYINDALNNGFTFTTTDGLLSIQIDHLDFIDTLPSTHSNEMIHFGELVQRTYAGNILTSGCSTNSYSKSNYYYLCYIGDNTKLIENIKNKIQAKIN